MRLRDKLRLTDTVGLGGRNRVRPGVRLGLRSGLLSVFVTGL